MSAFSIANQTVTDLLPQRKAAPPAPEPPASQPTKSAGSPSQ